jgi:tetratricopeptide (TPR) repeat protein
MGENKSFNLPFTLYSFNLPVVNSSPFMKVPMKFIARFLAAALVAVAFAAPAIAQNINLLPKFGGGAKTENQKKLDDEFLKGIDAEYKGDKDKASREIAAGGWEFLQRGNLDAAMVRFNQSWLVNSKNGNSFWGMAIVLASAGKLEDSLKIMNEAEVLMAGDSIFAVDQAKIIGLAGAQLGKPALTADAMSRFEKIFAKDPKNAINLQNWAITLFYGEKHADAWAKIKLAEATGKKDDIDPNFIEALSGKMPRPN